MGSLGYIEKKEDIKGKRRSGDVAPFSPPLLTQTASQKHSGASAFRRALEALDSGSSSGTLLGWFHRNGTLPPKRLGGGGEGRMKCPGCDDLGC